MTTLDAAVLLLSELDLRGAEGYEAGGVEEGRRGTAELS